MNRGAREMRERGIVVVYGGSNRENDVEAVAEPDQKDSDPTDCVGGKGEVVVEGQTKEKKGELEH